MSALPTHRRASQMSFDDGFPDHVCDQWCLRPRGNDGFPAHGNFRKLIEESTTPRELLDRILSSPTVILDQWQVQRYAMVLLHARVALLSELSSDELRRAHLTPVPDIRAALDAELARIGRDAPIAILPEGPLTIPYLA